MKKLAILLLLIASTCFADGPVQTKDEISGFTFSYPIDEHKHLVIQGKIAFNITKNEVTADDVLVKYYENGELTSTMKADHVVFNKTTKQLQADGHVKIKSAMEIFKQLNND